MSWRLVDGVPLPLAVGGHPALDFCNTRAGWGGATPKEYLTGTRALLLWTREAGLLEPDAAARPIGAAREAAETLRRALALRESLYRCALGTADAADWGLVSREAAAARAAAALVPGVNGRAPASWQLDVADLADAEPGVLAVHAVAASAEDLLTSSLGGVVAACPGEGCGWLFADPRRRRRWCSMAVCGNRAKSRRHAQRRGTSAPGDAATVLPMADGVHDA